MIDRLDCGNYRSIRIMDSLAKVYHSIILKRLELCCCFFFFFLHIFFRGSTVTSRVFRSWAPFLTAWRFLGGFQLGPGGFQCRRKPPKPATKRLAAGKWPRYGRKGRFLFDYSGKGGGRSFPYLGGREFIRGVEKKGQGAVESARASQAAGPPHRAFVFVATAKRDSNR